MCRRADRVGAGAVRHRPVIAGIIRRLTQPEHIVTHKVGHCDFAPTFEMADRNPEKGCEILLGFAGD